MPIIRNYGLRWSRSKVQWGRPGKGNEGKLDGKVANLKSSSVTDFREQIGIYVLFERGFVPVYIGQAGLGNARLFHRLKNHTNDHLRDRWEYFSWFGFRGVNATGVLSEHQKPESAAGISYKEALSEIEGILIQVLEPRLNRQGPKWQQTADEYVQAGLEDESVRLSELALMIEDIKRDLASKPEGTKKKNK
jgi:hypothetical protein